MSKKIQNIAIGLTAALLAGTYAYFSLADIVAQSEFLPAQILAIQIVVAMSPIILGIAIAYFFYVISKENAVAEQSRTELKKEEKELVEELKLSDTDFATLWSLTQARIDYYHQIVTTQARRSFVSSQIATAAGFALIIAVAVIAARATNPVAAISAGVVGVVGGGLSAYLGATFMRSQTEATAQLRQFFMQPVEFSRLLGAERLLENLEADQKSEAIQQIIKSMMFSQTYGEDKKEP